MASLELKTVITQGTFAARPAANAALEYYVTTGTNAGKRYWSDGSTWFEQAPVAGGVTDADYLVGTAHAGLSAEIVVGTTPGGELGGTWASPTVDATHSGSTHAAAQAAAEATAAAALSAHEADTTSVHGIANTANLYASGGTDVAVADGGTGSSTAGGARTNLGLVIGTDVQAFDADIPTVAASQAEMEAGTEAALRSVSPLRVAQAIAALATGGTGDVATDTIWDAAGDLVQGTGSNASARLAAGTAGHVLTSQGAAAALVWAAPSGGSGGLLAVQRYAPGADGDWNRVTASMADVDATNAAVTFTAPASGNVLIRASFFYTGGIANHVGMVGLRVASSTVAGPYQLGYGASSQDFFLVNPEFYVSGLTPTTSYTYKLAFQGDGTATMRIYYGPGTGGSNPPFVMTVWAAP